jgi:hypothetical protein
MTENAKKTRSTVIPTMRYEDGAAAIDWLCRAFGFEKHLVVPGERGTILHAQLSFGNGMIMLGSVRDDDFGSLQKTPRQVGGIGTQSAYVIVDDADAHYARASPPAPRSSWRSRTKSTADGDTPAATRKGTSGTSALTIRGRDHRGGRCRP